MDENGTEASAATATSMVPRSAMPPDEFIADHPFMYFIVSTNHFEVFDEELGYLRDNKIPYEILFAGIYC